MGGSELVVGFVRGATLRGDLGVAFVRRRIDADASTVRGDARTTLNDATLYGFEIRGFKPFATIKELIQPGVQIGVGVAAVDGAVAIDDPPSAIRTGRPKDFFRLVGPLVPLLRVEVGGTVIVTEALKVRVTGGLNVPGQHRFNVGLIYLFGRY